MSERGRGNRGWTFRLMIAVTGVVAALLWLRVAVAVYRYLGPPFRGGSHAAAVAFALVVLVPLVPVYFGIEYWFGTSTNGGADDG